VALRQSIQDGCPEQRHKTTGASTDNISHHTSMRSPILGRPELLPRSDCFCDRRHTQTVLGGSADAGHRVNYQTQPVFMCCRMLDVGAHHACWLLLQALFMTASVLTVTSTTATRTMTKGLSMVTSRPRLLTPRIFVVQVYPQRTFAPPDSCGYPGLK
jgi:hypothetical protein